MLRLVNDEETMMMTPDRERPVIQARTIGWPIGTRVALLFCLGSAPPFTLAAERDLDAHEHGAATLDIALDGARLYLDLGGPADNVLGFEHAPSNDAQRALVAEADRVLGTDGIFVANAEAGCTLEEAMVDIALPETPEDGEHDADHEDDHDGEHDADHADEHDADHEDDHDGEHDGEHDADHDGEHHGEHGDEATHSEFTVAHVLLCDDPAALRTVTTTLFEDFEGFVDIDVQLIGPGGQDGADLTADRPVLALESIL